MMFRPLQRLQSGRMLPFLAVIIALVGSAWVYFKVTKPMLERLRDAKELAKEKVVSEKVSRFAVPAAPKPETAVPKPMAPVTEKPKLAPPSVGFARPMDLGREVARSLSMSNVQRAAELLSAGQPDQEAAVAAVLGRMLKEMKVRVAGDAAVEILGMVESRTRLAIALEVPGSSDAQRLELDLERDARMGWKVVRLEIPKALAAAALAMPALPNTASKASAADAPRSSAMVAAKPLVVVAQGQDALSFSNDFVRALLRHDFAKARSHIDEQKVSTERLAGLCIVFEEGQYEFKPDKPMVITVSNPEVSWVIAQVRSKLTSEATEFGLELQRQGPDQAWKVVGLNLSEILGSFAAAVSRLGVPYTPIVRNPTGGESLALYFEYDKAALHPRAQKQIAVVAGLLKSDAGKKLRITGHTDAKGADDYNIRLSKARAETVRDQLVALGVSPNQVITTGLGKAQPLGPNQKSDGSDDPEGRSRNRRAEIFLDF